MNKGDGTSSSDPSQSSSAHSIPGGGVNPPGQVPGANNPGTGSGTGTGSGGSGGGSGSNGAPACEATGFSQHCGSQGSSDGGNNSNDGVRVVDRTLGGSAFAVVVQ